MGAEALSTRRWVEACVLAILDGTHALYKGGEGVSHVLAPLRWLVHMHTDCCTAHAPDRAGVPSWKSTTGDAPTAGSGAGDGGAGSRFSACAPCLRAAARPRDAAPRPPS